MATPPLSGAAIRRQLLNPGAKPCGYQEFCELHRYQRFATGRCGHFKVSATATRPGNSEEADAMDERVSGLLTEFPVIFEKVAKSLGDLESDWVIIDEPDDESRAEQLTDPSDEFLSDLDRFEDELSGSYEDASGKPPVSPFDIPLPPDIDLDGSGLIEVILRRRHKSIDKFRRKIAGNFPGGANGAVTKGSLVPPPDALAVYLRSIGTQTCGASTSWMPASRA
jgi:hypothetical protein